MRHTKLVIFLIILGLLSTGCGKVSESVENKSKWKTVYKNDINKDFIKWVFKSEYWNCMWINR